jgi:hypothetical protein
MKRKCSLKDVVAENIFIHYSQFAPVVLLSHGTTDI